MFKWLAKVLGISHNRAEPKTEEKFEIAAPEPVSAPAVQVTEITDSVTTSPSWSDTVTVDAVKVDKPAKKAPAKKAAPKTPKVKVTKPKKNK